MKPIRVLLFLSTLVLFNTSPSRPQPAVFSPMPLIDQYGAPLPAGACQRLGDPRQSRFCVNSIAIVPDGRLVALAHNDRMIYLWNLPSAQEVRRLTGHQGAVTAVAFAPDGSALASASDDWTVRIWDVALGKEKRRLVGHNKPATAVAYSPDGTILASGGWDNKVYLWEAASGKKLRVINVDAHVTALAFSADGQTLAAGTYYASEGQDTVRVWDAASGSERFHFGHEHRTVNAVAFSPDGRMLASANDDDTIGLVEVATGRVIRMFRQHGYVKSVAFSPDGRTLASAATGGQDIGPRLWEVATGQVCRQFHNPAGHTVAVAFTPDGKTLISGGRDMTALLWPLSREDERRKPSATGARFDPESRWEALKARDASGAYKAVWEMIAEPEASVTFLRRMLRPALSAQVDARVVADLDSPSFKVRESAMGQLQRLSEEALPELRQALAGQPSLEASRRLELVVRRLELQGPAPEWLRTVRALQILEQVGTRQARALLETLAAGAPGATLTREARAALGRVDRRAAAAKPLEAGR